MPGEVKSYDRGEVRRYGRGEVKSYDRGEVKRYGRGGFICFRPQTTQSVGFRTGEKDDDKTRQRWQ